MRGDGTLWISGWATSASDATAPSILVAIVPAGTVVLPPVLGSASLPGGVAGATIVAAEATRAPVGSQDGIVSTPSGPAGAYPDEMPWPPGDAGTPVWPGGGHINAFGRRWVVKDSAWAHVAPGGNVFGPQGVWVDNYGLHLSFAPTAGCNAWVASEVWTDQPLGYGSYVLRFVSQVDSLVPDMTFSPIFLWSDDPGEFQLLLRSLRQIGPQLPAQLRGSPLPGREGFGQLTRCSRALCRLDCNF